MTSRQLADEHIFIRPGTDAAALIAMAYVIMSRRAARSSLLRSSCSRPRRHGVSRAICSAESDGMAKTPEWAEAITGIPAATLRRLAIEFATTKPAALQTGYAPGRTDVWRAVPPCRLCAGSDHRQCRHRRRQFRHQQRRNRPVRHPQPADRPEPDRSACGDAAAGRSAGTRQGGRLSGRHQADLFGGRRSVQPVPECQQDGLHRSKAWSSSSRRTTS